MITNIRTFAKLNLFLHVFPSNASGLHRIHSIFQSVSLFDSLDIEQTTSGDFSLTCAGIPVDDGPTNLISKIVAALRDKLSFGLKVRLEKRIPLGAGLGGGSSNAAAMIDYLNNAAHLGMSLSERRKFALQFGSDIPFFLTGGQALVSGIGDKISPSGELCPPVFLLIMPPLHCDTGSVYKSFDRFALPAPCPPYTLGYNALAQAAFNAYPVLSNTAKDIESITGLLPFVSGSGSTLYMPFDDSNRAVAIETQIRHAFPKLALSLTIPVSHGYQCRDYD